MNVTVSDLNATVASCTDSQNADSEISAVEDAVITSCGSNTTVLSLAECHTMYQILLLTVPTIAFDWFSVTNPTVNPSIFFKMYTDDVITPDTRSMTIYNLRNKVADTLSVPMDKVLIEIRETDVAGLSYATSRRLLAAASRKTVIYVWVYPVTTAANGYAVWPSTAQTLSEQYATWKGSLPGVMLPSLLTSIEFDSAAETSSFRMMPTQPALHQFSIVVPVDMNLNHTAATTTPAMITAIIAILKKSLAAESEDVTELDIRSITVTDVAGTITRFTMEIRVPSSAKMRSVGDVIAERSTDVSLVMQKEITDVSADITGVTVRRDKINLVEDSFTTGTASQGGLDTITIIAMLRPCWWWFVL